MIFFICLVAHTGINFGNIFIEVLDKYKMANSLVSITANNASNNSTLAARVEDVLSGQFKASKHLLGCMAHFINLAAKDGLQAFGVSYNETENKLLVNQMDANNQMHVAHLTCQPNGIDVILKTVILQMHGLTTYVQATPQRREQFQSVMTLVYSHSEDQDKSQNRKSLASKKQTENGTKTVILDVKTRWNSTYLMLERALKLQDACTVFCH
jgi:hypothetical protein